MSAVFMLTASVSAGFLEEIAEPPGGEIKNGKPEGKPANRYPGPPAETGKEGGREVKTGKPETGNAPRMEADIKVNEKFQAGLKKFQDGDYVSAADKFLDAEFLARNIDMKAQAAKEAMLCYRKANLLYKEFEMIEKLLNCYPAQVDFAVLVDREYDICDKYYQGHRDPEFWSLRWIPWLEGPDHSKEMIGKALKHAPFSQKAPEAKLRLAVLFIEDGDTMKGLDQLRELVKDYPDSKYCKYAYLELGNALFQLSKTGDGDGKYNNEALSVFKAFKEKYPKAAEIGWVDKCLLRSKDIQAKRLLGIAKFYKRIGRTAPAERYLNDILMQYPDSKSAEASEEILSEMDKAYVPEGFRPPLENRYQQYDVIPIPSQTSRIIMVPENSDGKHLYPIRDLGIKREKDEDNK
ncbi:MAG: outer membrane protein assembly factor BamD [Victivallales bacterium]|nr:outer membrane protein assembly factor BamD [Victivallales bacterium]